MRVHLNLLLGALDPGRFKAYLLSPQPLGAMAIHLPVALGDRLSTKDLAAAAALWNFLRRERPGLLHLHGRKALLVGAPIAHWFGIPYVYTVHGFPNAWAGSAWEDRWLQRAAAVILVSAALVPWAEARGLKEWVVIPNALRPEVLKLSWAGVAGGRRVITVARLNPDKGVDLLLRALREVPGATLQVIGSGPEEGPLKSLSRELGLDTRVSFAGSVPDPGPRLAAADVYVQPSRSEGFGLAALEAMAIGLPVAASAVGGLVDLLGQGERGWLFPPEDPVSLAATLEGLSNDPQAAGRREAARQYARRFTAARLGEETMAVYERLL